MSTAGSVRSGDATAVTPPASAGGSQETRAKRIPIFRWKGIIPLLLFAGVGVFLLIRGSAEEQELGVVRQKERLLVMIQAQGKVTLSTIMVAQHLTRSKPGAVIGAGRTPCPRAAD